MFVVKHIAINILFYPLFVATTTIVFFQEIPNASFVREGLVGIVSRCDRHWCHSTRKIGLNNLKNILTWSACPSWAAATKGVTPIPFGASGLAPASRRTLSVSVTLCSDASCTGVQESMSLISKLAPASMRIFIMMVLSLRTHSCTAVHWCKVELGCHGTGGMLYVTRAFRICLCLARRSTVAASFVVTARRRRGAICFVQIFLVLRQSSC